MTAAGRYQQLESPRTAFLERARDSAKLTIPTLVPPAGAGPQTKYYTPFQGIGARGLNNLAAKLLLALLPPNSPFFRLQVDDFTLERITQREGMRGEVEKALNRVERAVMMEIETSALRVPSFELIKQLIVSGNVLAYLPLEGGMRVFRLDRFVVHRDPMGNVLEIITKEEIAEAALPETLRKSIPRSSTNSSVEKTIALYTRVTREATYWKVYQEVNGSVVPGSRGQYPLDKSPWIPLRWTKVDGEDYGRGYIEEYLGDLRSLEALTQAIVEGSAAAARVLLLVNPNGTTTIKTITDAPNGAVRAGNKDDVSVLQLDKYADFQIAFKTIEMIQQRLSMAFMLNSAIQRNGERVTAEEIRYMAGELEDALGGVYSILSQEFQYPLVNRLMFQMERQKRLPQLPRDLLRPTITTGVEALGRGHDLNKLDTFVGGAAQMFGPETLSTTINVGEYLTRRGTALGIDMNGLVRTPEEQAATQQQGMLKQMLDRLGPKGMDILRDQLKPEAQDGAQQAAPARQPAPQG